MIGEAEYESQESMPAVAQELERDHGDQTTVCVSDPTCDGAPVNSFDAAVEWAENPVAWTNTHNGGRVFYTSLGHIEDFHVDAFRALLINGIRWAAG